MGGFSAGRVVAGIARIQFAALFAETQKVEQTYSMQGELKRSSQHAETIFHAAAEINGRGFFKILGRTRDLSDAEAEVGALGQHLIIEDEVVGIFEQRQFS